ncbi:hypothetical protein AtEden1_Chr1g0053831 [Arabidopsis thaliana]
MATETMKKIYSVLMIVVLFTMIISTYASTIEVCVKHCVPNQCMKASKTATLPFCENCLQKSLQPKQICSSEILHAS